MPAYPIIHRDYETRSEANLKKTGAHAYAEHPSTKIMVAVWIIEYAHGDCSAPIMWFGNMDDYAASPPFPMVIAQLIEDGATVAGHNAAFEAAIDAYHAGPMLGWPLPKLAQLDCTMARAAVQGLPQDLERLGKALGLSVQKDKEGHSLMLRMCKPRKAHQDEDPNGVYWHYDQIRISRLAAYCIIDVRTEIAADHALRPLQDQERPVWELDHVMNNRGVQIDREFVDIAEAAVMRAIARANLRMSAVTDGAVDKVNEIAKLKAFAMRNGVEFKEVEKTRRNGEKYMALVADREALQDLLVAVIKPDEDEEPAEVHEDVENVWAADLMAVPGKPNLDWVPGDPPSVRASFELRLEAGKSSLKKLAKFRSYAPWGRARGNLQYHAASPGRWAGRGIQMQNMVRKGVNEPGGWDQAYADMRDLSDETFEMIWGPSFDVISRMMRGALIAAPGRKLYFADFSNVEARGCVWAAGQDDMTALFAADGLIYEEMGAFIFDMSVEEVLHLHKSKKDIIPRFVGKETILGCGYGLGWAGFRRNCKKKGGILLPEATCWRAVDGWRERNDKVVKYWHDLELAAKKAIHHPGQLFSAGPFTFRVKDKWLQCRLPSGRLMWYRRPQVKPTAEDLEAAEGAEVPFYRWKIHYLGVNGMTKQWAEETTWGGKILENCIQGMCADFLRGALLRLEAAEYWPILSVHDEPISEVEEGFGSVEEYVALVSEVPPWAQGFPLKAVGGTGTRYAKA